MPIKMDLLNEIEYIKYFEFSSKTIAIHSCSSNDDKNRLIELNRRIEII
jgi:hypothetical protein